MNKINKIKPPTAKARLHRLNRRHCGQAVMAVRGFTLIELIVSVTIIAVLTVVGVVSFTGTNRKARDSRRMADMENVRMALELYKQGTGSTYPSDDDYGLLLAPDYIQEIPVGPKGEANGDVYIYTQGPDGYSYTLSTILEETGADYIVTNP